MTYHLTIGGIPSCASPLTSISIFAHRNIHVVCSHRDRDSAENTAASVRDLYEAHGHTFNVRVVYGRCGQSDDHYSNMYDDGFQAGLNRSLELARDSEALRAALVEHGHYHIPDAAQEAAEADELERHRMVAKDVSDAFHKSDEYLQMTTYRRNTL